MALSSINCSFSTLKLFVLNVLWKILRVKKTLLYCTVHIVDHTGSCTHQISEVILCFRYAHTAHVVDDILILIGGVSFSHKPPGVTMVHLPSGNSAEFSLPVS